MMEPFLEAGKLNRFPFPLCSDSIATSKWMPPSQGVPEVGAESESEVTQLYPTLWDPVDCSLPGLSIHGILQARILEWVAISFSNAWKWKSESEVVQSCPTLHYPMDCSLPGSSVHGIFQARVLEWGAIAFSDCSCYFGLLVKTGHVPLLTVHGKSIISHWSITG